MNPCRVRDKDSGAAPASVTPISCGVHAAYFPSTPAKLYRHGKGIFLKREGEDARAAGNLSRRKTETGFDAHTIFLIEARPSFRHRKDKWSQHARGGASRPGIF